MAGSVLLYLRRPAIRLEPALLSVGRLVFQPVRVAASLRAGRVAGARRRQHAAFPGPLPDRSPASAVIYLAFAAAMTLAAHLPELQELFPRVALRGLQSERQDQSGALSLPASGDPDHPGSAADTDRCAGTAGRHLAAAGQMRPAIPRGVLRRNLPFVRWHPSFWTTTSDGVLAQLLVGAGGLAIMTAVAYYRSWSKRAEKQLHADSHHAAAQQAHLPIGELVQQDSRAAAGVGLTGMPPPDEGQHALCQQ